MHIVNKKLGVLTMTEENNILTQIRDAYEISYSEIARRLGISRQYISNVVTGSREIGPALKKRLKVHFPELFEPSKHDTHLIKIKYCPAQLIPHSYDFYSNNFPCVSIDKRLLPKGYLPSQNKSFIVTLSDDSLSPFYLKGDKVILDLQQTALIDGLSYLILVDGVCYIRKLQVLPDRIKCISTKDDRDTFSVEVNRLDIQGLIIPNVRF